MTRDEMLALVNQRCAAFARLDADALAAAHARDGVYESPFAGTVTGRDAVARVYRGFFGGFPDLTMEWSEPVIDGDRVVQMATASGTDTGGFMGLPPSRKRFGLPVVFLLTFVDGLIAQERCVYDFTGMLVQIGVLKTKPV
jgi:steroid delta-isomerase-like uncharacterized protein